MERGVVVCTEGEKEKCFHCGAEVTRPTLWPLVCRYIAPCHLRLDTEREGSNSERPKVKCGQ